MKRAQITRFGPPPEVVELVEVELARPGPGEALVRVEASPINPADLLKCRGLYGTGKSAPTLPFWGGVEGVGRVEQVGADVTHLKPDDLVTLARTEGVWGERLLANASLLAPLPAAADPLQVAMVVVNPPTAELMLTDFVALSPGDWVIQDAANSAVGHHVIRLARLKNLRTVNVVRRPGLADGLAAHGADVVVEDGEGLMERVKEATGGALARLAIDAVGGAATARLAACLEPGGTVVNYGLLSGEDCRMPATMTVFNDIRLAGFWLPRALAARSREEIAALYARLTGLVLDGTLKAEVEATYPLARIADALAHAERSGRTGKVLITP
jgi:NADPH:quinone reductase-like Zn-dependent oxidoreductase